MRFMIKFSSLASLIFAVLSGALLFYVSQQVQEAERTQKQLQAVIEQEQEALRVLSAEWDYLNRPDRLEALARTYLNMEPMKVESALTSVDAIPMIETPPTAPVLVGTDNTHIDKTTTPQMIQNESTPPVIGAQEPSHEPNFSGVLNEAVQGQDETRGEQ